MEDVLCWLQENTADETSEIRGTKSKRSKPEKTDSTSSKNYSAPIKFWYKINE